MEVAAIFLGPIIEVLLDKLVSRLVANYARREGIDRELKKLEKMLPDIRAVLADAEEKQTTDDRVKSWMEDLSDLAYDLDDLLDDIGTEALRLELTMSESQASSSSSTSSKVRKLIPTCFTCVTPPQSVVKLDHNMMSKVEEITTRLEEILKQKNSLDLKGSAGGSGSNKVRERRETSSLVDISQVYGRQNDKESILELLLTNEDKVSVIPIVGMGGIGKTTLAQLVYDDERLKGHFDLKGWACVSDDFDVGRVTKTILEAVTSTTHDFQALNMLQQALKEKLSQKKFLLILDDVWNEKYEDWELLQRPFMVGAPGSKIIVTTRHGTVASTVSLSHAYPLNELSKEECLSLFAQHAFGRANFDAHPNLKGVGEQIVMKCKGLPLAAKTLGGVLRNKSQPREWEDILNSKIWELPEQKSGILPALKLSYYHLPSHLKLCFAYCAIFPKDYEFDKVELILLWMAVGLLQLSKKKKPMEDFGDECFNDLLSRSFFQQSGGSKSRFVMHDLLNDLALHVAGNICFRLDKLEGNEQFEIPSRHLSYIRQEYEVLQKFKPLCKVQHLRTLLPLPIYKLSKWDEFFVANKVLSDLLPKLPCLRVLSFSGYSITELPDSIGDLKHLRYLNLSETLISRLPESVCTLCNLQTLLLRNCNRLCMMPSNIENLISLRHLDITGTVQLREMSSRISRLTNLQTLSKFIVGKNNGPRVKDLRNLRHLRGSISITELQNVTDLRDANEANLKVKQDLDELELVWCSDFNDSRNENLELDVLDNLQPHINLKRLKIEFYGGINFSSWLGDPSFSKLEKLTLVGCRKCSSIPSLGHLSMLKDLCIRGMHEVKKLGDEFYGDGCSSGFPFPSLETLKFVDMPAWEEWSSPISSGVEEAGRHFPCLRKLTIQCCPKLISVSLLRLPSLHELYVQECQEVVLKSIADVTSLTSLRVEKITGLSRLEEALVQSLVAIEVLVFRKCNQLVALWQNGRRLTQKNNLDRLQRLEISGCVNLEKLPDELNNLTSLTSLIISECPKLVCFPKTGVPPTLKVLGIWRCEALKSLPEGISGLEKLYIVDCSSLRWWPTDTLPTTLNHLEITNCLNLEYYSVSETTMRFEDLNIKNWPNIGMLLGCVNTFVCLRELQIYSCNVLESFSFPERESGFPNLRLLVIDKCVNLRSLSMTNLIPIKECQSLESFPERGRCLSTPNLRSLYISDCANLSSLPFDEIQSLASLKIMTISGCPLLEFFSQTNFHFPPNLVDLSIRRLGKIVKPLSEWGLHRLTSLRSFTIEGGYPELLSFPTTDTDDESCPLPTTLTKLIIEDLPNLESISLKGLQNLTSLQRLLIYNCPKLQSLPNLTSLQHLLIEDCPKLQSLPKEGLPLALQRLGMNRCPLLEKRCSDGGDYCPNIAYIPRIQIENVPYRNFY